jgi:hypothetical protein
MKNNLSIDALLDDFEKQAGITAPVEIEASEKPSISVELEALLSKEASDAGAKSAHEEGRNLAKEILAKLTKEAGVADANTTSGVTDGTVPNKIQQDNAEVVVQDTTKVQPTVTSPDETVDDVLHNLLSRAIDDGAQPSDQADAVADQKDVPPMGETKQAEELMNEQLIDKIASLVAAKLTKQADSADANTVAGVTDATAPNKIQQDNAEMVAQDDSKVQPLPAAGGTLNQILDAIVNTAVAQGAQPVDRATGSNVAAVDAGTPASEEQEKAAAVSVLVESGVDFDDAVNLVKAAEYEILEDQFNQEKVAAAEDLIESGMDAEAAVDLVKSAVSMEGLKGLLTGAKGVLSGAGKAVARDAGTLSGNLANVGAAYRANGGLMNAGVGSTLKALAKNKALLAGAGTAGVVGAGVGAAMSDKDQEKKAAFDTLVENGLDYVTAAALVEDAAAKIYG